MLCPELIQVSEPAPRSAFNRDATVQQNSAANVNDERREAPESVVGIIDDDDWVCDSLSILLETYGFSVKSYRSGAEFLADRQPGETECLVIDQHMPGLDGLDVVAELRRQGIAVPTILITGRLDPGIAQRADRLGVLGIIEKPFAVAPLIELIRRAGGRRD